MHEPQGFSDDPLSPAYNGLDGSNQTPQTLEPACRAEASRPTQEHTTARGTREEVLAVTKRALDIDSVRWFGGEGVGAGLVLLTLCVQYAEG